ncbi:hypothetical protein A8C56_12365 [Niabella ginsenosidivorans]|uniref:Uncharacterized protein n=1 Tax=Niabella ginsenosidivorans TaxID=1176587 RepID=A0A1A9I4N7_9BACT|nr:hypothetical protein [Niabella ginsenosidivorans]ANH81670.1 hypothetical protein A8C56_12365 [Niabella ginsenosidivorans]
MEQQNILTAIKDSFCSRFQTFKTTRNEIQNKIYVRQRQIERLNQRLKKLHGPHWTEDLLRPVLDEIKKQLPGWDYGADRLIPMGLGCRVSVFFTKERFSRSPNQYNRNKSISIVFLPGELDNAELLYETGKQLNRYGPDTIGAINGFNRVTKPLQSVEEAVSFLKAQIKTQKKRS